MDGVVHRLRRGRMRKEWKLPDAPAAQRSGVAGTYAGPGGDGGIFQNVEKMVKHLDEANLHENVPLDQIVNKAWQESSVVVRATMKFVSRVTKTLIGKEKDSDGSRKSRGTEMSKMMKHKSFDPNGMELEQARKISPRGTYTRTYMISCVKHAELSADKQKFKARLVVLGDRIFLLANNARVWDNGVWSPVTSLAGIRCVFGHAAMEDMWVTGLDVEAAYLQVDCDTPLEEAHWLILCPEAVDSLEEPYRSQLKKLNTPTVRMLKCMYGHPKSGALFINALIGHMVLGGWVQSSLNRACLSKGNSRMAVYVDDVTGCGDEMEEGWRWLERRFEHTGVERVEAIVGIQVEQSVCDVWRTISFNTEMYILMLVGVYRETFGINPVSARSPQTFDLRKLSDDIPATEAVLLRKVQKIVGMLLWVCRVGRFDCLFVTSQLSSRMSKWCDQAQLQLTRCVSYLWNTRDKRLVYRVRRKRAGPVVVATYTDSDLRKPRCQSGVVVTLSDGESRVVVDAWSRKQSIGVDNTPAAEFLAAHGGVRDSIPVSHYIHGKVHDFELKIDNNMAGTCSPDVK